MNRLIIVGNGFDLAHKMKSSYADFILDYLKGCFYKACESERFEDDLISIARQPLYFGRPISIFEWSVSNLLKFEVDSNGKYIVDPRDVLSREFKLIFKSKFVRNTIRECGRLNWVNIENNFYRSLTNIISKIGNPTRSPADEIDLLNSSMDSLTKEVNEYFTSLTTDSRINEYTTIFKEHFRGEDFSDSLNAFDKRIPEVIHVLCFNYTNTVENYLESISNVDINYIHGRANSLDNPIIFGFGDEMDEHYKKLESVNIKGVFKYIKSFGYFRTSNYHKLIKFLDSDLFQIFIVGHSCGLSDRTMLNMVFEHSNCCSIKIFYHGDEEKNNYRELTEEISRHFRDKSVMRRRIVSFDRSMGMPQAR